MPPAGAGGDTSAHRDRSSGPGRCRSAARPRTPPAPACTVVAEAWNSRARLNGRPRSHTPDRRPAGRATRLQLIKTFVQRRPACRRTTGAGSDGDGVGHGGGGGNPPNDRAAVLVGGEVAAQVERQQGG